VLVNLGEAAASSDAGDRFSSFMAADGFPKSKAPHWTTPNFKASVENDSNGFVCNQQQLPVNDYKSKCKVLNNNKTQQRGLNVSAWRGIW